MATRKNTYVNYGKYLLLNIRWIMRNISQFTKEKSSRHVYPSLNTACVAA